MRYELNANTSKDWQIFEALHEGRDTFFSAEEYAEYVGYDDVHLLLTEYRSWSNVCQKSGLNLTTPAREPRSYTLEPLFEVVEETKGYNVAQDFSNHQHIKDYMVDSIKFFVETHGRYPNISDVAIDNSFVGINHYLETFGTWSNACNEVQVKGLPSQTLEGELHHTLAYYSSKLGYDGKLMIKEDWDRLSTANSKLPSSHILKKYSGYTSTEVVYDPSSGKRVTNEWQALAVKADLDFDGRGRGKIIDDLKNTKETTGKYISDSMSLGKYPSYGEWVDYCHELNKSLAVEEKFLPAPLEKLNKHIVHSKNPNSSMRGVALLQQRAENYFKKHEEHGKEFEKNRILREKREGIIQEHTIDASEKETNIHDRILNISENQAHTLQLERQR